MADDGEIDIEGEYNFKLEVEDGFYDTNELPSKSANLLPEFTNPPWMLEQGWTLDNYMDEKSKATIERMLLEEQQYLNGRSKVKEVPTKRKAGKNSWTIEEKQMFVKGLDMYGRSWRRIAELIPSRTDLQVKNYAQHYFKTKKATHCNNLTSDPTCDLSSDPLSMALASVTTGQPTVVSPCTYSNQKSGHDSKFHIKSVPDKTLGGVLPMASKIVGISGLQDLHCSPYSGNDLTPSEINLSPSVNLSGVGFLSGTRELAFDSSVSTLISVASGLDTLAAVVESDPQTFAAALNMVDEMAVSSRSDAAFHLIGTLPTNQYSSSSDTVLQTVCDMPTHQFTSSEFQADPLASDDSDIDIENDDDDDMNPVLIGRSASPSSVYDKLLRSANVTPDESGGDSDEDVPLADPHVDPPVNEVIDEGDQSYEDKDDEVAKVVIVNGLISTSGEVFEFVIPTEEHVIGATDITDVERKIHSEFFDGRQSKTPERYLKIRSHILDCWKRCQPTFLNKTSVRSGLKNCGDVNCIGRIHHYLECIGAINFGCEQASYFNPVRTTISSKGRLPASRDSFVIPTAEKLDSMRPRKRRMRDALGHWVDVRDLEGKTIEHKNICEGKRCKTVRPVKYDPFQLIACQPFTEEHKAPFNVTICNTAIALMDIHAHISRTEVIGLLGGRYDGRTLNICMVVPCLSLSTGMQCEMEPVSQTEASDQIIACQFSVVGWYHSHPTFAPNPSVRDIETQVNFQEWFGKGGNQFVGMIVSPYYRLNPGLRSEVTCLTINKGVNGDHIPYSFDYITRSGKHLLLPALKLADSFSNQKNSVFLHGKYKLSTGLTCLQKMMVSVRCQLQLCNNTAPSYDYDDTLQILEEAFSKQSYAEQELEINMDLLGADVL